MAASLRAGLLPLNRRPAAVLDPGPVYWPKIGGNNAGGIISACAGMTVLRVGVAQAPAKIGEKRR